MDDLSIYYIISSSILKERVIEKKCQSKWNERNHWLSCIQIDLWTTTNLKIDLKFSKEVNAIDFPLYTEKYESNLNIMKEI